MAKLADAQDLESCDLFRAGSNPVIRTTQFWQKFSKFLPFLLLWEGIGKGFFVVINVKSVLFCEFVYISQNIVNFVNFFQHIFL